MKKLFFALALTITAPFALVSCMNGDYDADPKTDLSKIPNPFNDLGAKDCSPVGKLPLSAWVSGSDEFVADPGDPLTITQVVNINGQNLFQVQGHAANFKGQETVINLLISGYTGARTYTIGGSTVAAIGPATNPMAQYSSAYGGGGKITITRDDQDTVAGNFYFKVKNSNGESKEICGGTFKLEK